MEHLLLSCTNDVSGRDTIASIKRHPLNDGNSNSSLMKIVLVHHMWKMQNGSKCNPNISSEFSLRSAKLGLN